MLLGMRCCLEGEDDGDGMLLGHAALVPAQSLGCCTRRMDCRTGQAASRPHLGQAFFPLAAPGCRSP